MLVSGLKAEHVAGQIESSDLPPPAEIYGEGEAADYIYRVVSGADLQGPTPVGSIYARLKF
jgi:hypothetical protein